MELQCRERIDAARPNRINCRDDSSRMPAVTLKIPRSDQFRVRLLLNATGLMGFGMCWKDGPDAVQSNRQCDSTLVAY